jgi:hypothetical protein
MSTFVISQLLVGVAFVFSVSAFQFSDQRLVRGGMTVAAAALAVHFWLLDLDTAAVAAAIAGVRFFVAIFYRNNRLFYLFISLVLVNAVLSYSGLLTVLATIGTSFATWGAFRNSDKQFRLFMMCASIVMILHNLLAQTPAAIALESFFLGSNLLAYYRIYIRGTDRQSQPPKD